MKHNILMACLLLLAASAAHGQDSTALINKTWSAYASYTSLTFRQIVSNCDSQFALAGYPDTTRDANNPEGHDEDGDPYMLYTIWKNFWSTRLDVSTGKLHNFAADALASLSGTSPSGNCAGTSSLQSGLGGTSPGWEFIGPQNITSTETNLKQHLGRVGGLVVNPFHTDEILFPLWKPSPTSKCCHIPICSPCYSKTPMYFVVWISLTMSSTITHSPPTISLPSSQHQAPIRTVPAWKATCSIIRPS